MIFNKSYMTAFSKKNPYLALASRGKILDSKFTLTSELNLYDYSKDIKYQTLQTDSEYCKLVWCEKDEMSILATGHTNGTLSLYEPSEETSFKLLNLFDGLTGNVQGIDYNPSKNVIAAGSCNGNIIFWNLDKIDQQYKCDISIKENITCLSWNKKVSRILCAGTECGKILILDIRAKNIAMTLQNKELTSIYNVEWHPKNSTSILASSNLNHLSCFKLDSNSMSQIGKHESSVLNFEILSPDLLVSYSENKIDYVDLETFKVKESINIENVYDISFCTRDPLYCASFKSGKTEVLGYFKKRFNLGSQHVQFNNSIIGRKICEMELDNLELCPNETLDKKIINILYKTGKYEFYDEIKRNIAETILENEILNKPQDSPTTLNLEDTLIVNLIKRDYEQVMEELSTNDKEISLKYFLGIFLRKEFNNNEKDGLYYLLNMLVNKDYNLLIENISEDQLNLVVAILLYSELENGELISQMKNILEIKEIPIIHLLINQSSKYLESKKQVAKLPKSPFEIRDFFEKFGCEFMYTRKLNISCSDAISCEFFWYAKNRGLFNEIKDTYFENREIKKHLEKEEIRKEKEVTQKMSNLNISKPTQPSIPSKPYQPSIPSKPYQSSIPSKTSQLDTAVTHPSPKDNRASESHMNSKPSSLYSTTNKSVTSFSTKPLPRNYGSQQPSTTDKSNSFFTKPMPRTGLYSTTNKSVVGFSTKPNIDQGRGGTIPSPNSTYSSSASKNNSIPGNSSIPINKPMPTPKPKSNSPIMSSNKPFENNSDLDTEAICTEFESRFEEFKTLASKKSNLIINNKIKDATRRFAIFQQIDKTSLSPQLLQKMSTILSIIREGTDLKLKLRPIVDDCLEMQEQQCDIWIPSIFILVQIIH